jgi:hypothetical protein
VLAENQRVFENLYKEQFEMEPNSANEYGPDFMLKRKNSKPSKEHTTVISRLDKGVSGGIQRSSDQSTSLAQLTRLGNEVHYSKIGNSYRNLTRGMSN